MAAPLLALVIAAQAAADAGDHNKRFPLVTTESVERISLPEAGAPYSVNIEPLESTVVLRASHATPAFRKFAGGTVCKPFHTPLKPHATADALSISMHCRSRRIDAFIEGHDLLILELRGLPWRAAANGPPRYAYAPEAVGLGDACPGSTPAGQAECELQAGHAATAKGLFEKALAASPRDFAAMRLGDIALSEDDAEKAAGWYVEAGDNAPWGWLAAERRAELIGHVLWEAPAPLDVLPEPIRLELEVRKARWHAYLGEPMSAARTLLDADTRACDFDEALCRTLLLAALRTPNGDRLGALALYLHFPKRRGGPLAVELAAAAAEDASAAGASRFGANLMSSMFPKVPVAAANDYLRRTAELYLAGGDHARAEAIYDYARAHAKVTLGKEWNAVLRQVSKRDPAPKSSIEGEKTKVAIDLTAAKAAIAAIHANPEEESDASESAQALQ